MKIEIPKQVLNIVKNLEKNGSEIYIVGGAVRDILMDKKVYDWDFTTNATPSEMLKIFPYGFYDNKFGTVGIPNEIEGERPYEITTFRTEHGYSDTRRPDKVEWGKTLQEDLQRRDFTINALALKITDHRPLTTDHSLITLNAQIIDLFNGKEDLEKRTIRAVGDPNERFSEDALRVMRALRIAAELGFLIEEKTFLAIAQNAALINKISHERVRDELLKILSSPHPYEGMLLFKDSGLMEVILPELTKAFGVEQASPGRHHIYDVGTHSLFALKYVSERNSDPIVRFATLIHDIGKPQTFKRLDSGTITFYNHEVLSGRIAKQIASRLRFSKKQTDKLWKLVRYHQFTVDERQTDSALRRFLRKVGLDNVPDMLDLRVGDRLGGGARETSWRLEEYKKRLIEVQKQPFTVKDLQINGNDVMKILSIPPGPKVGEILNSLFEEVVEKKIENEREVLTRRLKDLGSDAFPP